MERTQRTKTATPHPPPKRKRWLFLLGSTRGRDRVRSTGQILAACSGGGCAFLSRIPLPQQGVLRPLRSRTYRVCIRLHWLRQLSFYDTGRPPHGFGEKHRVQQRGTPVRSFVARSSRSCKRPVCCDHPKVHAHLNHRSTAVRHSRVLQVPYRTFTRNWYLQYARTLVFYHRIVRALTDTLPFSHPAALRIHHRDQPAKSVASTAARICYETAHCTVSHYFSLSLSG